MSFKQYCQSLLCQTSDEDEQEAILDVINALDLGSELALEQHFDTWSRFLFSPNFDVSNVNDQVYALTTDKLRSKYYEF